MSKTLIGKNGFLFLQNDSARELEVHNDNLCLIKSEWLHCYKDIKPKYLIVVFPNKSFLYKEYLPDKYNLQYRPAFDIYKCFFENHIVDGLNVLKNTNNTYYKTDSHINFNGNYVMYQRFIEKIKNLFGLIVPSKKINMNQ